MADRNIEFLLDCLSKDDDEAFWRKACALFFHDALDSKPDDFPLFIEIGLCSNWIKSAGKRFTESNFMPLPQESEKVRMNYARLALPEYDWSMIFYYDEEKSLWTAGDIPDGNFSCLRCALPANTGSLHYAVGHTARISSNDISIPMLYSFRKSDDGEWECFINPFDKKK